MRQFLSKLKDLILRLRSFAARAARRLFTGKVFRRASTKTRTISSFLFYGMSIISLIAWLFDLIIDTLLYTPTIALGALLFKIGEKIHGPYPQEEPNEKSSTLAQRQAYCWA